MPVPVPSLPSLPQAPANISRRDMSKYGQSPSLYDLLCSVAFEKSTFIPGCQKRNHDLTSQRKHVLQGHSTFITPHGPALSTISEVPKPDPSTSSTPDIMTPAQTAKAANQPLVWDWALEHADRKKEARADAAVHGAPPFQVDRKLLKDIVHEKMNVEVARITFLGAGTFHKGYLVTLVDGKELVARVARRFMPRLKTESEVATMKYLRERTTIPVPTVYHYDANPYNRLGGEYILMSKAAGVPLSRVFHSMSHEQLMDLMRNVAMHILPLYGHRFPRIGSLYSGADPLPVSESATSTSPTPTVSHHLPRNLSLPPLTASEKMSTLAPPSAFHVGPIISWPFFGSNRGDLSHPDEINRGPWPTTHAYLQACADREIQGVVLENEGKTAPHRLHLDPDEIITSRHHKVQALTGDVSDASDEWDQEESEAEWDGPGNRMYQDYRRMQRSTFLLAHLRQREQTVKEEMGRFVVLMHRLGVIRRDQGDNLPAEEFALDPHDLNLENVFVDENDNSKITCVIDWESTTTRPLWAAAHVPAFLQNSPFTSKLFRATVENVASQRQTIMIDGQLRDLSQIAEEWLHYEASGARLRMAHRCIEWDGWEEGLVQSILGPADQEEDWFKSWDDVNPADSAAEGPETPQSPDTCTSPTLTESVSGSDGDETQEKRTAGGPTIGAKALRAAGQVPVKVIAAEKERERLLNSTGDICGGRGGELGRRLEAWLSIKGDSEGRVQIPRRWSHGAVDAELPAGE